MIAGFYNVSRSAQFNVENILFIESAPLADTYSAYIDHLKSKYAANSARFAATLTNSGRW